MLKIRGRCVPLGEGELVLQYINVTDRTDRQWSDTIVRIVLQMVAQKSENLVHFIVGFILG